MQSPWLPGSWTKVPWLIGTLGGEGEGGRGP